MCDASPARSAAQVVSPPGVPQPAKTKEEADALNAQAAGLENRGSDLFDILAKQLRDRAKGYLPPPPQLPDLSDELVQRAASAQRLRQMMTQGVGLTGVMGLPTPTRVPGLGGA